jgi:TDG/mug DNA glycosylase family protein
VVTAVELARRLGVDPKRFRSWLRSQAAAGHPLLGGHLHYARWEFSEGEAEQLAVDFGSRESAGPTPPTRRSRRSRRTQPPRSQDPGHRVSITWNGERIETLADLLRPGLRAVCVGINPSPVSVAAGHYYRGRVGQRFWARLRQADVLNEAPGFEDDTAFAAGIGFTDIIKRPSPRADDLSAAELERGRAELREKLLACEPGLLVFTFKKTAVALFGQFEGYGHRPELGLAGIPTFVMPGPYERADRVAAALTELGQLLGPAPS